jgi:hypothetical protein
MPVTNMRAIGNEDEFAGALHDRLHLEFGKAFTVCKKENLIYSLQIDPMGQLRPKTDDLLHPKRGQLHAFQTDILVRKISPPIPLVVIEVKFDGISTHDVSRIRLRLGGTRKFIHTYATV